MPASETVVFTGGTIRPLDGRIARAEALAVRDGRVLSYGSRAQVRAQAGAGATTVELDGASLLPGLVDTHPHVLHFGAFEHPLVRLWDAKDWGEIIARLRARAETLPPGTWLMGTPVGEPHYFIRRSWRDLAERTLPDRTALDRASTRHPVMIQAWAPVIPNVCAFNSAALAALGISRTTPDRAENVWIEKDVHGDPTGRLHGSVNNYYTNDPFMNELLRKVPLLQPEAVLPGTIAAMTRYNQMGITTVYEGHAMGAPEIAAWRALSARDALTLRVLTTPDCESYGLPWSKRLSDDEFRVRLEKALAGVDTSGQTFRQGGVTLSRGGPCWPGFLRRHEPYRGPYGELTNGVTFVSEEREQAAIDFCARTGLRLGFVGAGDRDHDEFLANAEIANDRMPGSTRGWILQHVFFLTERQAARYAALGIEVTTSLSFSWGKGELFRQRIGDHVLADLIPLQRMLEAGLPVACGSDWGPKNVFEQIQLALTHEFAGSGWRNDGPAQRVSRENALAMWTHAAARILRWEQVGTLEPGAHADLIVVDRDPLTCPLEDLPATRVLRTLFGGRVVHDAL